MKKRTFTIFFALISTFTFAQNSLLTGAINGNPLSGVVVYDIEFVESGNNLVLAIADYNSGDIIAVDYNWSTAAGVHDWTMNDVPDILNTAAGLAGVSASGMIVRDMKVNPRTKAVVILMQTSSATFLVEVKSPSDVSLVSLSGIDYCVMSYTSNGNYIFDMAWDPQGSLYYTTGDFTLDAEIGTISMPFTHGGSGSVLATTLFKSNWGGSYFTSAPLELISVANVDGTNRLMGVTTCAPGFSIPTSTITGSNLLSVTEDFNVNNDYSLSVVTQTQGSGNTTTYLYDLHINQTNPGPTQLIRVGEKYLDGSQAAVNQINNAAEMIRVNGAISSGLTTEEATVLSTGFHMIAKYSEDHLMVVDDNEVVRLINVNATSGLEDVILELAPLSIYPSPATESIQFDFAIEENSNTTIKIWNTDGKLVYNGKWDNGSLDVSSFAKGSYILNLQQDGNQIAQGKFIKQ